MILFMGIEKDKKRWTFGTGTDAAQEVLERIVDGELHTFKVLPGTVRVASENWTPEEGLPEADRARCDDVQKVLADWQEASPAHGGFMVKDGKGKCVAMHIPTRELARLISTAPEMVKALESTCTVCAVKKCDDCPVEKVLRKAGARRAPRKKVQKKEKEK